MLPNEPLSTIFEICHESQARKDHFEILVSSVTQHWRDVVLRTPKLWNMISCVRFRQQVECIALYMYRLRALPIELEIKIDEDTEVEEEDVGGLCQLLLQSVNAIHLDWDYDSLRIITDAWAKIITSTAQSLTYLAIDSDMMVNHRVTSPIKMFLLQTLFIRVIGHVGFKDLLKCIEAPRLDMLALNNGVPQDTHGIRPNSFSSTCTLIFQDIRS